MGRGGEPPAGQAPLCWLLRTTQPVTTLAEAVQAIPRYGGRGLVERLPFALPSGGRIAQWQRGTAARRQRALATYRIGAGPLLGLTYEARRNPEPSCPAVWERTERQVLHQAVHPAEPLPAAASRLGEAAHQVARWGGFLARRHDGAPGVKILWRGRRRLQDLVEGYRLGLQQPATPPMT